MSTFGEESQFQVHRDKMQLKSKFFEMAGKPECFINSRTRFENRDPAPPHCPHCSPLKRSFGRHHIFLFKSYASWQIAFHNARIAPNSNKAMLAGHVNIRTYTELIKISWRSASRNSLCPSNLLMSPIRITWVWHFRIVISLFLWQLALCTL